MAFGNRSNLRRIARAAGAACIILSVSPGNAQDSYGVPPGDIKARLDRLVNAYPDWISRHDSEFLFLKDGTKYAISDKRTNKTFEELLETPDIDDMFFVPYPAGTKPQQPVRAALCRHVRRLHEE